MIKQATSEATLSERIKILIVEDESIIALNLKEALESLGYSVPAIAASGEKAVTKAAEIVPDIVLMDIRLKGTMDGIQAAEQIWNRFQIPAIYVTGHSDQSTLERAKATSPFGYIVKPVKERELYVAIEIALQRCAREQWLTAVLNAMGDGVIVVNNEGFIQFLNPVAEALTGWSHDEARNRTFTEIFTLVNEETRLPVENPVMAALQQGIVLHSADRTLLIAKDGKAIPIANTATPFRNHQGIITGVVLVFRDITERQQAQERNSALELAQKLEIKTAELQRLNQLKEDFLSTVSHELRTPLANIQMAIHTLKILLEQRGLLAQELEPKSASVSSFSVENYMEILQDQCDRELRLINDLLELQRLSGDTEPLDLLPIQIRDWLPYVLEDFQARTRFRQQQLQLHIVPDLPVIVSDMFILNRILAELLNNACKYTPSGEQIVVTAQVAETLEAASPNTIQIQVTNFGVEIPTEALPRIFEPFYRIPPSDRSDQGGTGLGLTLVKRLVNNLGGSIEVESNAGQTSFTINLPIGM